MNIILAFILIWSAFNLIGNFLIAVEAAFTFNLKAWSLSFFPAIMYTLVAIDSGLRIFSHAHTGLW